MKYIASWSGGKDSTAMVDMLLRKGDPLDYIVFLDTTIEFKEMYAYIEKVKAFWEKRYCAKIVILKTDKNFKDTIFGKISRGNNKGVVRGFLSPSEPFCSWRRDAKIAPFEKWVKKIGEHKVYIGFTNDESHRAKEGTNQLYPLIGWGMKEKDCQDYLKEREMENPLYRHFTRTGCRVCPYQSERDWYNIYKHHQEVWEEMREIEEKLKQYDSSVLYPKPFRKMIGVNEYEAMFKGRQELDFGDEPLKDCFCKI